MLRTLCLLLLIISSAASSAGTTVFRDVDGIWKKATPAMFECTNSKARHQFKRGNIEVTTTYQDMEEATGAGFDDPTSGLERRETLDAVLTYIVGLLDNNGALEVYVQTSRADGTGQFPVATAGPFFDVSNPGFSDGFSLLHITTGVDPSTSTPDMSVVVDFGFNLNTGLGDPAPDQIDLFSVLLHEITHGLGMLTLSAADGTSQLSPGVFSRSDSLLYSGNGSKFWDDNGNLLVTPDVLTGSDGGVEFRGTAASSQHGSAPKIYAPAPFEPGSSLSHWDASVGNPVLLASVFQGTSNRSYDTFEIAALGDLGYAVNLSHRLVYTWISNSDDFESTLVVNNPSISGAQVTFTARRADGALETTAERLIPSRGFLQETASSLFPELGRGPGYTVTMESDSAELTGRWVTNDRPGETPSQGIAVRVSETASARQGSNLMLGYLPGNANYQSVPVLTNLGANNTNITVYFFDAEGTHLNTLTLTDVPPLQPKLVTVVGAGAGDQYAVASSSSGNITGVVFVFNGVNQTAIGNATTLSGFTPP